MPNIKVINLLWGTLEKGGTEFEEEFAETATGIGNLIVMSGGTNGSW